MMIDVFLDDVMGRRDPPPELGAMVTEVIRYLGNPKKKMLPN